MTVPPGDQPPVRDRRPPSALRRVALGFVAAFSAVGIALVAVGALHFGPALLELDRVGRPASAEEQAALTLKFEPTTAAVSHPLARATQMVARADLVIG